MRRAAIFAAVLASLPLQAAAQQPAYRAVNWLIVVPVTANSFEVLEDYGEGARGMWCAAGDYARNRIGVPVRAQLYLKGCLLYTSPSPRDRQKSRMPSSA